MYLYRFGMKRLPFGLTPDTEFYCATPTHTEALNVLKFAINSGESLIKIVGEVGTGKTMLCRLFITALQNKRTLAYIPYPKLNSRELKFALAKELGIKINANCRDDQLSSRIQTRLLNLNKQKGSVILLIDEAQLLDNDGFETLRLFTNLETQFQKLLQIVIFGQPELNKKLNQTQLRQVNQRIAFSYHLKPLSQTQIRQYIQSRLKTATKKTIKLTQPASYLIAFYSKGIPRLINILCHKALLLAYGQNKTKINALNILRAAKDTDYIKTKVQDNLTFIITSTALLASSSAMALWMLP